MMEGSKEFTPFAFDQYDTYSWYLSLGSLANADARHLHGQVSDLERLRRSIPNYDAFWQREAVMQYLDRVTVPTLNVAGWWDQEDFYGPLKIYETLEKHDTQATQLPGRRSLEPRRVARAGAGRSSATSISGLHRAVFPAQHPGPLVRLLAQGQGHARSSPKRPTFEAGANAWRSYESWPPKRPA